MINKTNLGRRGKRRDGDESGGCDYERDGREEGEDDLEDDEDCREEEDAGISSERRCWGCEGRPRGAPYGFGGRVGVHV